MLQSRVVLHVGGEVAVPDADQNVRFALSTTGCVVGKPAAEYQRRTGLHRRDRLCHRFGLAQRGFDAHRVRMQTAQTGEYGVLERLPLGETGQFLG